MEKPVIRISVRNLVEFILRNGDLESGGTAGDKEAMLKGSRLHRKIQKQMGSHYQAEVSLKKDVQTEFLRRMRKSALMRSKACIRIWNCLRNRFWYIVHRRSAMPGSIWMIMDWKRLMFR